MKFGIVTREPKPDERFDMSFYYVKEISGKMRNPAPRIHNVISCFGDNKTAKKNPEWVATSNKGPAMVKFDRDRFCWNWICATNEEYRHSLLDLVKKVSSEDVSGIVLDCIEFPGEEYCTCDDCSKKFEESGLGWLDWKKRTVMEFVREASNLIDQEFAVGLYPDPFHPGRFGLDINELSELVNFFLVPIYDRTFSSVYWVEIIANAFSEILNKTWYIEINVHEPEKANLSRALRFASEKADGIVFSGITRAEDRDKTVQLMEEFKD